jgi:hypothetical protein
MDDGSSLWREDSLELRRARYEELWVPRRDSPTTQSGKSNNRHHPFGLISPSTTWHDAGRRKNVQPTQLNPPRGIS